MRWTNAHDHHPIAARAHASRPRRSYAPTHCRTRCRGHRDDRACDACPRHASWGDPRYRQRERHRIGDAHTSGDTHLGYRDADNGRLNAGTTDGNGDASTSDTDTLADSTDPDQERKRYPD